MTAIQTTIAGEVSLEDLCARLDGQGIRFCVTADENQFPSHFSPFNLGNEQVGATKMRVYGEDENGDEIENNEKWFYRIDNPMVDVLQWGDKPEKGVALYDEDGERHEFYFLTACSL